MPLGNGRTTALAWSNTSTGGVGIYLGSQDAMSAHAELFKLALLQVAITPNPWAGGGSYFNQTLDLATGTFSLHLGGANLSTHAVHIAVYVDANADALRLSATAGPAFGPFSLRVVATSTRPSTNWSYAPPFSCDRALALPDVYADPLPPPQRLTRAAPARDAFRHAGGGARPLRALFARGGALARRGAPTTGAFQPGSLLVYHRNTAAEGTTLASTLLQQGLGGLLPTVPDHWSDLTFGFALDADDGPPLLRMDAHTLASAVPARAFLLRATVLAVQTDTVGEWVADVAALLATAPPSAAARAGHEAWWAGFWGRSYVAVNASKFPAPPAAEGAPAPAAAPPVPGALLWLRAASLAGQANATPVAAWGEPSLPNATLAQANATLRPVFVADAFGAGAPGVRFDGVSSFLEGAALALPGADSTHFAVFRDAGSTTACCSGVLFFRDACVGVSTAAAAVADDDDGAQLSPVVAMADFPGSETLGSANVHGRVVVADVVYGAGGVALSVDGCAQAAAVPQSSRATGVMVGTRGNELQRFFRGDVGEVLVYPRALNASEVVAVRAYLAAQWPQTRRPGANCSHRGGDKGFKLSQMYAVTRYTQAVQSRNTLWPIKFNGMAFVAAVGSNGEADYRDWGACNWWQNTRLPYGSMLAAGDADVMRVVLDYYANAEVLLSQRTLAYWNHSGMWTTETHHLSGAYCGMDYGCSGRDGYPVWLETSGWLHVVRCYNSVHIQPEKNPLAQNASHHHLCTPYTKQDQGGDSGTGEWSLMALDYLSWTNDTAIFRDRGYLRLATQAAEFFMHHFSNRSADGRVMVWPAQVLETFWCTWDPPSQRFVDCCANDSPTISGMITLFEKLLQLPPGLATPEQAAAWASFRDSLLPPLPTTADGGVIAAAEVVSSGAHNSEGPELFAVHPHRVFTRGREVASGANVSLGRRTVAANQWAAMNEGWNYGINARVLIGDAEGAAPQLLQRAATAPAAGYRWPGFAPHFQDFEPSADHFANMNRALQEMLIQSGEDGFLNATIVLFPAWPCGWDVSFKLWGPQNTTVEAAYAGGVLVSLDVQPPWRAGAIKWAGCVAN
jgi:hypothetical protein